MQDPLSGGNFRFLQRQMPQKPQYKEMDGIEQVKEVFHGKSQFPIVEVDGDKRQAGGRFPQKADASGGCHQKAVGRKIYRTTIRITPRQS